MSRASILSFRILYKNNGTGGTAGHFAKNWQISGTSWCPTLPGALGTKLSHRDRSVLIIMVTAKPAVIAMMAAEHRQSDHAHFHQPRVKR